jgi:hypothetical protein
LRKTQNPLVLIEADSNSRMLSNPFLNMLSAVAVTKLIDWWPSAADKVDGGGPRATVIPRRSTEDNLDLLNGYAQPYAFTVKSR